MVLGFGATFLGARLLGGDDDADPTATEQVAVVATDTPAAGDATATDAGTEPTEAATEAAKDPTATTAPDEPTATEGSGPDDATATSEPNIPQLPEGREVILFSSHRGDQHESQIYIMNPDGTGQTHLTPATGHSWGPRISPDGEFFFFSSVARGDHAVHDATGGLSVLGGSGNHDIYLSSADGSEITNITVEFGDSWDNGWSWSPDGQWITFSSDRNGGNWDLYKMTPDGATVEQLTNDSFTYDGWPSWTPDGQHIVFARSNDVESEIYIMDADGSNVRKLVDRPGAFDTYPFVSPDGTKIVFSSQSQPDFEGDIYVMNIDGSDVERLTSTAALNYAPSWSPDGTKIIFVSDRTGNPDIWIMDADGENEEQLTDDPGDDTTPAWGILVESDS
jgi:TolB protein